MSKHTWFRMATLVIVAAAPATARADSWQGAPKRPQSFAVGIGAGWTLPSEVTDLNTAGVRFRFANGLTLEPRVEASESTTTVDVGGVETKTVERSVSATATARYPVIERGRTDFVLLGGASASWSKNDPWDSNNTKIYKNLSLIWGLAVDYWLSPHWAVSANATNPLLGMGWQSDEHTDTNSKSHTFGAIFDPSVLVMVHLFY